jgi:hypothetical protein
MFSKREGFIMVKYMIAVAVALMMASTAHANLIVNGGFESPALSSGSWSVFSSIPGWTSTMGDGIEIQNHAAGNPFEGNQHVELDSNNNSNMIQTVATTAGASYNLSFAYSPRPGISANSNGIEVFFGGNLLDTITGNGGNATNWSIFNYLVTANGSSSTVEFRAAGISDSLGGYLDDVQLNSSVVPEPATLTLFGIGLSLAGLAKLRRSKK